ncbi:type III-A CRISPR-associated RAMP protein Csm5 [Peptostreptococcus sp. D1]|uniref:type III-A CRISPR-associated RAMP protein Csm5 n=1 Tax=Peptostreptococcus sp. D1 TaxID=72304 RepID=UPI0008F13B41|nr:type III-A CRISPR-associated RAMP protein Csm5 [Peptostreptococcus sp. D1]SFE94139.1 CRISPR-associated protein Csm5 [Peptostreptococcus sp. D1]
MKSFIESQKLSMEVVSPIFIGNGEKMLNKNCIIDVYNKKLYVPNQRKFMKLLLERNLVDSYEEFILDSNCKNLSKWMKNNNIYSKSKEITDYELDISNLESDSISEIINNNKELSVFIKDYYGMPYIPGSSIKGAIRTALIARYILDNPPKFENIKRKIINDSKMRGKYIIKKIDGDIKNLESRIFNTVMEDGHIKSKMSAIQVSDSKPLPKGSLSLCSYTDILINKDVLQKKSLKLFKEIIKPGTIVDFEVNIDKGKIEIDLDYILESLEIFFNLVKKYNFSKFNKNYIPNGNILLGGIVGFHSKTILIALLGEKYIDVIMDIFDLTLKKGNKISNHKNDNTLGVSPRTLKCTKYDNRIVKSGICRIFKTV